MDITTETPAAAPAAEMSLDQIINGAVQAADAKGEAIVQQDKPAETPAVDKTPEAKPTNTEATPGAEVEAPAEEPAPDEISAARARKILETVETRLKLVEDRERSLTAREVDATKTLLEELLRAPKSFLAKHGRHIDDLIDASVAEGTVAAPKTEDEDPRLTALEKRIEAREKAEAEARNQQIVAERKTAIHGEIAKSTKFPVVNELKRQSLVTDYMLSYHETHGTPISWDKAAAAIESDLTGIGIAAAKKLGWSPPAKTEPAKTERTASPTLSGAASDNAASTADADLPEDPTRLLDFLVRKAQAAG